ncbi:MAG: LPS translocon maturation chaperone LptM [Casimicrobiaceae bacterium]
MASRTASARAVNSLSPLIESMRDRVLDFPRMKVASTSRFRHVEPRILPRCTAAGIACMVALALASCGIKGPLRLPPPKPVAAGTAPATKGPGAPLTTPPPSTTPAAPPPAAPPTAPGTSGNGKQ